jgi:hypothetical protein
MESQLIVEINAITDAIKNLQKKLATAKYDLFMSRILTIVGGEIANIKNIKFTSTGNYWVISYKCQVTYDENNYNNSEDSEVETSPVVKCFEMTFGREKRYFINGNQQRFKIYRNSSGKLRILNSDYTADLDIEEQETLLNIYSFNYNIPEWFAIKIFLFMDKNDWSDENLITYLDL